MLRLVIIFFVALCLSAHSDPLYEEIHGDGTYTVSQSKKAQDKAEALRREWEQGGLRRMAQRTDQALNGIIRLGIANLKKHGFYSEAKDMEKGWLAHEGEVTRIINQTGRKIGDFEPLSTWLAVAYFVLEEKLGYDICRALRFSDLMTFNFTIPVVFSPCKYGLTEFTYHFVHDDPNVFHPYKGLAPVVAYWTSVITCSVATFGAGYFFICSPIGMLVELGVDRSVAPWLAPKIYNWSCS